MNKDVAPDLLEKIMNEYSNQIKNNSYITSFEKKLVKKTAKDSDVSLYGDELGSCAAKAFLKYITPDNLPDGKLYWNVAERIINVLLKDVYTRVNYAADIVQGINDKRDNIKIKPQHAPFPKEKIHDLIDKTIEVFERSVEE